MDSIKLDEQRFVDLLSRLIGEVKHLQNNPPNHIPCEDRAGRHVLDELRPYSQEEGGPLKIQHISFVEGRGNIIVEYPGQPGGGIMSIVGSHLDVVTANPETWDFDPFSLTRDGDKLRGRGTTDCLGHVALLTQLFRELAIARPPLQRSLVGVWISNEENSKVLGVGVDELVKQGYLKHLLEGPLFWLDTADSRPCIGTGGIIAWQLTAHGKMFHSGLPHQSVNPLELASEALAHLQRRFYQDFPPHPQEVKYGFATPSTMKPTQWSYPGGSINQIPGQASVSGDCRLTPFYDLDKVMAALQRYVEELNADLSVLPTRGPVSKYSLPAEGLTGRLELTFYDAQSQGIACNLDSPGYHALLAAFQDVLGSCTPFAITGSLPCIRELQDEGYDVQTLGFGLLSTYHAVNEHALLSDFVKGFRVLTRLIERLNQ
ncbi:acetylornithine deacetylase [Haematococcus lacustris]